MPKAPSRTNAPAGFSVVEALLAATLFGLIALSVIGAIVYGRQATAGAGDHARGAYLAEEGVEAVRNIRAAAYSNLVDGTYGLVQSGNVWTLSGSSDTTGSFTRQVTIASNGTNRKTVTATVTWPQGASTAQASAVSQLTNWAASFKSWVNATLSGSYDATGTTDGYRVATQGNYAYLVRNVSGSVNFLIINISNPASPSLTGSLTLANTPTNIAVNGNYAYVSNSNSSGELQIVNVTTPSAPSLVATYNAAGNAGGLGVFASGNYVYLSRAANSANGELTIVNVTTPSSPTLAGAYSNNIAMNDITVSGNYAYIATNSGTAELLIVNVSNPASPSLAGSFNATGSTAAAAVAAYGTTAYIAAGTLITAVNVTTPASPVQLGTLTLSGAGNATDLDLDNTSNYLFVGSANTTAEFRIISTSNPASMSLSKTIDVSGTSSAVNGVRYNSSLDIVVGASGSDTQELVTFIKN